MINQFRSLNPVNLIFLAVIAIILRTGVLLRLPDSSSFSLLESYTGLLINIPEDLFTPFSSVFYATVVVLIQAILLNRIVNNYNLLGKPSFMPALLYVTATALLEPFIVLNPVLIANFLVLWMIEKFMSIYRREKVLSVLFDLGMIVAAGTLIYFPFIAMLPLLWISLIIFRPFNWREWVAGLTGFITICFFVMTVYYLNGSLNDFFKTVPLVKAFHPGFHVNPYDYIVLIPVLLILVSSAFTIWHKFYRSNVHVRKAYFILLFLLLFSILSFSLSIEYEIYHFLLAIPALAIFMSHFFLNATKRWFYESVYLLLAAFIIYFQFV
ncbi:DUF6427 family protein [Arcticibacter tournemirensis]